ncbi:phage tail protein [Flaviaesturariibacter amylovorans]|uniref:Tail fiber protein n=1 Tax=Flaviaesturariibacter amylovorans TaxID=1084520 RepID=A0ABP8GG52_9BACT
MDPFIGEIKIFGGNFAPRGWAMCQGQLLSIAQNSALFSLLGTMYGGDGVTTFGLPDLRGRTAIGMGQAPGLTNRSQGEMAGTENVSLVSTQIPMHAHPIDGNAHATLNVYNGNADIDAPVAGASLATVNTGGRGASAYATFFSGGTTNTALAASSVGMSGNTGVAGGSQPHDNMQPYLALNYIIALQGIYPSRD